MVPTLIVLATIISVSFGEEYTGIISFQNLYLLLPLLLAAPFVDPGPLGEKLGWRGFALPRLLESMGALPASILLGFIWGVWHLPRDIVLSQFTIYGFSIFVLSTIALSILMTWVYRSTGGSVFVGGFLIHLLFNFFGYNLTGETGENSLASVYAPHASLLVAAIVVVFMVGPALISHKANEGRRTPQIASPKERIPEEGTPKITVERNAENASSIELPMRKLP